MGSGVKDPDGLELVAYRLDRKTEWPVRPAGLRREWMDAFSQQWPYRCPPLNIANQSGWELLCPVPLSVTWDGGAGVESLAIEFDEDADRYSPLIRSHFGEGLLTFAPPLLFRTREPLGLFVRGPCNFWLDGAVALDGWVESWGLEATFTMNWKLTRAGAKLRFEKGQPICLLQPFEMGLLERVRPVLRDLPENPELAERYQRWKARRLLFGTVRRQGQSQHDYLQGRDEEGAAVTAHRTGVALADFASSDRTRPGPGRT